VTSKAAMIASSTIIVGIIRHQRPHDILHPGRQGRQTLAEIGDNGRALILVGQDLVQPPQDAPPIIRIGEKPHAAGFSFRYRQQGPAHIG
jgi:hypothetical protein